MMIFKYPLMNEAGGMGDAGGGVAAPVTDPASGGGDGGQSSGGSVLSGAAGGADQGNPFDFVPEKYRVFGEDESFNLEASAKKMSEGYQSLAKRLGSDEIPPESPEGYKIDAESFGEGFDAEAFMSDEKTQSFLKSMHAKGMTNAQVQEVLKYGLNEWAPSLMQGNKGLSEQECTQALQEVWSNEAEFNTQVGHAVTALKSVAGEEFDALMDKYGNDPDFIRIMAQFGREMGEDSPPNDAPITAGESIETLMQSEAYHNPKHPEHVAVSAKVKKHFEKQYGTEAA